MKTLINFILESNIEQGIDELTNLFRSTMLKDINLSESDFKKEGNVYILENISKDPKDAENFYRGVSKIRHGNVHTKGTTSEATISLVESGKDDIYIKINVEADTNHLKIKINKVFSAELSNEIKDKLI